MGSEAFQQFPTPRISSQLAPSTPLKVQSYSQGPIGESTHFTFGGVAAWRRRILQLLPAFGNRSDTSDAHLSPSIHLRALECDRRRHRMWDIWWSPAPYEGRGQSHRFNDPGRLLRAGRSASTVHRPGTVHQYIQSLWTRIYITIFCLLRRKPASSERKNR